jgi:hypothetical protein
MVDCFGGGHSFRTTYGTPRMTDAASSMTGGPIVPTD